MNLIHTVPGDTFFRCHRYLIDKLYLEQLQKLSEIPVRYVGVCRSSIESYLCKGFALVLAVFDHSNDPLVAVDLDSDLPETFLAEIHNYSSLGERHCSHQAGRNPRNSRRFYAKKKEAVQTCIEEAV